MEQKMLVFHPVKVNLQSQIAALFFTVFIGVSAGAAEVPDQDFDLKPLRDPFWPVGYFPENWNSGKKDADETLAAVSDWDAPAKLLKVSGTSRMGDQRAAIINGEVKVVGDVVEVRYSGRIYQWKLTEVKPDGRVRLERHTVKKESPGL